MIQAATQCLKRGMVLFLPVAALFGVLVVAQNASAGADVRTFTSPHIGSSAPTSGQHGYWLVGSDGGIFSFGSAQFLSLIHISEPTRPY